MPSRDKGLDGPGAGFLCALPSLVLQLDWEFTFTRRFVFIIFKGLINHTRLIGMNIVVMLSFAGPL